MYHCLNRCELVFTAERHQDCTCTDGGVKTLGQTTLGTDVQIAGQGGTVKEINMTYTMLATPDNKLISIPNSSVVAAQIVNYSAAKTRRVEVAVSASYEAPTQKVIDALVLAGTVELALSDPAPMAVVTAYGDSAISYSLRLWVNTPDLIMPLKCWTAA